MPAEKMALPREAVFPRHAKALAPGLGANGPLIGKDNSRRGPNLSDVAGELRALAQNVRRIGSGRGATPESLLIDKHEAADRLVALASEIEGAA